MLKRAKLSLILLSLCYIVVGVVLAAYPFDSLRVMCLFIGGLILAYGVVSLVRYARGNMNFWLRHFLLIAGILCCAVGAFLLATPDIIIGALPIVFGLFVIFDSLVRFGDVMQLHKVGSTVWGMLLLVLLSCGLGVLMVFNPFETAGMMMTAIGAILIVEGVLNLCSLFYTHVQVRIWLKAHPEVLEAAKQAAETLAEGAPVAVDVEYRDADEKPDSTQESVDSDAPAAPDADGFGNTPAGED